MQIRCLVPNNTSLYSGHSCSRCGIVWYPPWEWPLEGFSEQSGFQSQDSESSMLVLCLIPFTSMALDSFHSTLMCFVSFDLYSHPGRPAGQVIFIIFLFMHEKVKAWRGYDLPKVTMVVNSRSSTKMVLQGPFMNFLNWLYGAYLFTKVIATRDLRMRRCTGWIVFSVFC